MRTRKLLLSIAMLGLFIGPSFAAQKEKQDANKDTKAKQQTKAAADSDAAAMYPKPGKEVQAMIKAEEGVWDATMKVYLAGPNAEPTTFKGVETAESVSDGLWLRSSYEGDFLEGKKFKGHGLFGYDTTKKKYVGTWVDNMQTSLGLLEGDFDEKTNTSKMMFETRDPTTGQPLRQRHNTEYKADGHKVFSIYMQVPAAGDQWLKMIDIESKRRAKGAEAKSTK
jgi:hypothetical protein